MAKKVSGRRKGCTVALTKEERSVLQKLADLKYHGIAGVSTVLREEGVESARREIERLTKEKEGAR